MSDPRLVAAKLRAAQARERMLGTAQELQYRLKPSTLAGEARDAIRRRSNEIAEDAAEAVAKRPMAVSVSVAGIGALLSVGMVAKWRRKDRETS